MPLHPSTFILHPSQQRGFTLIELLVAIAIVAILATVAVASYQDHIRRSARAEAKAVLMELSGWMERNYTLTGRYDRLPDGSNLDVPPTGLNQSPKDGNARYNISFKHIADQAYTLQAAPTGAQDEDICGKLTLTHTGAKGSDGPVETCWNR